MTYSKGQLSRRTVSRQIFVAILCRYGQLSNVHLSADDRSIVSSYEVITTAEQAAEEINVEPSDQIVSDHSVISWSVSLHHQSLITQEVGQWNKLDKDGFRAALLNSELCSLDQRPSSADEYFDKCHSVLQTLADKFAPVKRKEVRTWFDNECCSL